MFEGCGQKRGTSAGARRKGDTCSTEEKGGRARRRGDGRRRDTRCRGCSGRKEKFGAGKEKAPRAEARGCAVVQISLERMRKMVSMAA